MPRTSSFFAGSVFEADGVFYAMYAGFNRDCRAQGKASQVLMIATSSDLLHWHKTARKLVNPQEGYDPYDWRDPYVFWNEDAPEFDGQLTLKGAVLETGLK
jgi:beta-fructofuranosidase